MSFKPEKIVISKAAVRLPRRAASGVQDWVLGMRWQIHKDSTARHHSSYQQFLGGQGGQ